MVYKFTKKKNVSTNNDIKRMKPPWNTNLIALIKHINCSKTVF